jgi:hypothetical protein
VIERGSGPPFPPEIVRTTHKFFEKGDHTPLTYTIEKDEILHTGII